MRIKYSNTLEDLVKFNLYHFNNSPSLRRNKRFMIWGVPVIIILIFGLFTVVQNNSFHVLVGILCSILYFIFVSLSFKISVRRNVRKMYSEGSNMGIIGAHELVIEKDGLIEYSEVSEHKISWKGIERIARTNEHVFIYIGSVMAHVIPINGVTSGNIDEFVDLVQQHMQNVSA
jgi:Ca2+/Na+ antiporter